MNRETLTIVVEVSYVVSEVPSFGGDSVDPPVAPAEFVRDLLRSALLEYVTRLPDSWDARLES